MSGQDLQAEQKFYIKVFIGLIILTVVTVALNWLHVGIGLAVVLALIVATLKASLVASFFMHLSHEKKIIYILLGFTMFFFIAMIVLIILSPMDALVGTEFYVEEKDVSKTVSHSVH